MEHFIDAFRNFANFSGRASRTQYWMFFLIYLVITVVLTVIESAMGMPVLTPIFGLVVLIPSLAYGARRLRHRSQRLVAAVDADSRNRADNRAGNAGPAYQRRSRRSVLPAKPLRSQFGHPG